MDIADQIKQTFVEETEELLSDLEGMLLDLETDPENSSHLDSVFRLMHTIKGSSGMVGEDRIYRFSHMVEDVFDSIRRGELQYSRDVADMALESRDIILLLLKGGDEEAESRIKSVTEKIEGLKDLAVIKPGSVPAEKGGDAGGNESRKERSFRIVFRPDRGIFRRGGNPLLIMRELYESGTVTVNVLDEALPGFMDLDREECYTGWEVYLTTLKTLDEVKDIFLFVEGESHVEIKEIGLYHTDEGMEGSRVGEILVERGVVDPRVIRDELEGRKKLGEVLVEKKVVSETDVESALLQQEHLKKLQQKGSGKESIRIGTEKVDIFVNLIGELVTLQAQFNQHALESGSYELTNITESLQRLTEELRDSVLGIRMIPLGQSFGVFRRLVRDLSAEMGKKINFITEGDETELDKTVLDKLKEPLVHIIRNSIDHGIERPEERRNAGKDEAGTIKLSAEHSGGQVVITILDDGKGINLEKVKETGLMKGLIKEGENLSDEALYSLLFKSGFSTAREVSQVSGRGVGMDVVRKEIENLQGSVSVTSEEGRYTRLVISLPLTLAIIDGLLVEIENDNYILPLSCVEACVDKEESDRRKDSGKEIIKYRDTFLPYISLRKLLSYSSTPPGGEQIVVVNGESVKYGMSVDRVIGDYQTVIKNLGKAFSAVKYFSGASIMGNGRIALILNPSGFVREV